MTPTTAPTADPASPTTPAGDGPPYPPGHPLSRDPAPPPDITQEMADRWAGKHVAWAWDRSAILAGADTLGELIEQLDRAGVNTSRVVFGYIDEPGVSNL